MKLMIAQAIYANTISLQLFLKYAVYLYLEQFINPFIIQFKSITIRPLYIYSNVNQKYVYIKDCKNIVRKMVQCKRKWT